VGLLWGRWRSTLLASYILYANSMSKNMKETPDEIENRGWSSLKTSGQISSQGLGGKRRLCPLTKSHRSAEGLYEIGGDSIEERRYFFLGKARGFPLEIGISRCPPPSNFSPSFTLLRNTCGGPAQHEVHAQPLITLIQMHTIDLGPRRCPWAGWCAHEAPRGVASGLTPLCRWWVFPWPHNGLVGGPGAFFGPPLPGRVLRSAWEDWL